MKIDRQFSRIFRSLVALVLLIALPSLYAVSGVEYRGKVVKVADGDALTILVDNRQMKSRLSDIDTPERKQPFGTRAKQAMSNLAIGRTARVVEVRKDRYGRIVGRVYIDGVDVNREL